MRHAEKAGIDPGAIKAEPNEQGEEMVRPEQTMDSARALVWLLQHGADMGIIEDTDSVVEMLENVETGSDVVYKKRHGGTVGLRKDQDGGWSPIPVERRYPEPA